MDYTVKVLMLSWEFPPLVTGGLGRHVAELAPALAQNGVEVHVVAPHVNPPHQREKLHPKLMVHWVDNAVVDPTADIYTRAVATNELLDARATELWDEFEGFDLIHAHDWLVGIAAIELKLRHKCPLVATIHATERGRWRNATLPNQLSKNIDAVERNLTFEAWRVIACSRYMVSELKWLFALPSDKLDMIPNGITMAQVDRFSPTELAIFRARYAPPDAPLIFSVGRLVYEKGFHVLLQAMPRVLKEFPAAKLVLAGKGPLAGELRTQATALGIAENVYFAGFISDDDRDRFFSVASCAVFPSLYEPFGIVALEAMKYGCPVVASDVGGLGEVVTHDETGTLIFSDDPESTAWGILHVLRDPAAAADRAAAARLMVARKYNWHRIARQTIEMVYRRVITERAQTYW